MAKRHKFRGFFCLFAHQPQHAHAHVTRLIILVPSENRTANAVHLVSIVEEKNVSRKEVMAEIVYFLC